MVSGKIYVVNITVKNFLIMLNNLLQVRLKVLQENDLRVLQKRGKATGNLIGNKIADVVAKSYKVAKSYNNNKIVSISTV